MDDATTLRSPEADTPPRRPRRSTARRFARIAAIVGVVLLVLILIVPWVASMGWARRSIANQLGETLGTEVRIADHRLGWFSGVGVESLVIENPPGFPQDAPAIALGSMQGRLGFWSLLRGRVDLEGHARNLEIRVFQRADGTTNLEALAPSDAEPEPEPRETDGPTSLADLRLDLQVVDSTLIVAHETRGVLERLENVHLQVRKPFGTENVELHFTADMAGPGTGGEDAGRIDLRVDAEMAEERRFAARLQCVGLDLARYRPVADAFLGEGDLTALAGVVTADPLQVDGVMHGDVVVEGAVEIENPHVAGALLGGLDLQAERWTLRPAVRATLAEQTLTHLDLEGFLVDLGVLEIRGLPTEAGAGGAEPRAGLAFDIDVDALLAAGGPVPEGLEVRESQVSGRLRIPVRGDWSVLAPEQIARAIGLDAELSVGELSYAGQVLAELGAALAVQGGELTLDSRAGRLGGGALTLQLGADLTDLDRLPLRMKVGADGARVVGEAVSLLQYTLPLLAGFGEGAAQAVDFGATLDFDVEAQGPALPQEGEQVLGWLNRWTGSGELAIAEGAFRPAPAIAQLLGMAGEAGTVPLEGVGGSFRLGDGFVETGLMKLSVAGKELGLSGRTSLAGVLDWAVDIRSLLAEHSDGRKVLEYLGDVPLEARIAGTLQEPLVRMPDIEELVQKAAGSAVQRGLEQGIQKGLQEILGGKQPEKGSILDQVLGRKPRPGAEPPPKRENGAPPKDAGGPPKQDGREPPRRDGEESPPKSEEQRLRELLEQRLRRGITPKRGGG